MSLSLSLLWKGIEKPFVFVDWLYVVVVIRKLEREISSSLESPCTHEEHLWMKPKIPHDTACVRNYSLSLVEGTKASGFGRFIGDFVSGFSLIRWGLLFRPLLRSFHFCRSAVSDFPANQFLSPVQLRCLRPHSLNPPVFLSLDEARPIPNGSLALDPRVRPKKIRTARRRHNCATPRRFSSVI
jgi:hypothetical protein